MTTLATEMDASAEPKLSSGQAQDALYEEAARLYAEALGRLCGAYEADETRREDLLQTIHLALWRSLASFDGRCSLRTWVFRVAHNCAIKHLVSNRKVRLRELHTLDDELEFPDPHGSTETVEHSDHVRRLYALINQLKPLDRQIILLYLEDFSAADIGEVVGLSPQNCATKIHRIKKLLASLFAVRASS